MPNNTIFKKNYWMDGNAGKEVKHEIDSPGG
jgi:hypothetical protein